MATELSIKVREQRRGPFGGPYREYQRTYRKAYRAAGRDRDRKGLVERVVSLTLKGYCPAAVASKIRLTGHKMNKLQVNEVLKRPDVQEQLAKHATDNAEQISRLYKVKAETATDKAKGALTLQLLEELVGEVRARQPDIEAEYKVIEAE